MGLPLIIDEEIPEVKPEGLNFYPKDSRNDNLE